MFIKVTEYYSDKSLIINADKILKIKDCTYIENCSIITDENKVDIYVKESIEILLNLIS